MKPLVLVLMGVSGSGKSTIAEQLAQHLGWMFQEGDALHPAANVEKMRAGIPLNDEDRAPWLAVIAKWIDARLATDEHGVITCSALKRAYRDIIIGKRPGVQLIYLHGDRLTLEQHIRSRHHEFMPTTLLDSQLATLEEPGADECMIEVDVASSVEHTVAEILRQLETPESGA
jgi:carbohydrate kinase (thermoresistant glucokinase family)